MSGHSHWATIKHKKGATDAKRGKQFSKLSRAIIVAARHGGGDPEMNLKLRYAIDKARAVSMPKENIERAVKRGTGDMDGLTLDEIVYEGFLGGVAVIAEVLTDNRNRAVSEINKIYERTGGKLGSVGCAVHLFDRKGLFSVDAATTDEDTLMSIALDAGADDLKRSGATFDITCDPTQFAQVMEALKKNNIVTTVAEITQLPKAAVEVDVETGRKVIRLLENLDDHDDVQNVYSTANLSEEMVAGAQ